MITINISSPRDLPAYSRKAKEIMHHKINRVLFARTAKVARAARTSIDSLPFIGTALARLIISDRQMPSFKQLRLFSGALGMKVEFKVKAAGDDGSYVCRQQTFGQGDESVRLALLRLMEAIYLTPVAGFDSVELRAYQLAYLNKVRRRGFRIHWNSLISYFAAGGYLLEVWLKDICAADEVVLPKHVSRFN